MLYITTALYAEARPFIEKFSLKKKNAISNLQYFSNDDINLIVTGTGLMSAVMGTTYLLSSHSIQSHDMMFNIGICGAKSSHFTIGEAVICNKIVHHDTKRAFYPDILFQHALQEGSLESFSHIVDLQTDLHLESDMVDMEGAGWYYASSQFMSPHQLVCIKVISDYLDASHITSDQVTTWIDNQLPAIIHVQAALSTIIQPKKEIFNEEEKRWLDNIKTQLRLTVTQYHKLNQLTMQYKIRTKQPLEWIAPYATMPIVSTKQERKEIFEQICKQCLYT
ncbi:5'-methylthioadenosine/S-adenosylhomocysteine nucleosidase family protein [Longirhabdus pacifica]|uniref:5'-methylthioadenosine/S-adenosylhomocysteine nucleosidase family protein n=1 Tax=Longirhabdus pacifica TaxID=2305227 RepID=UPI001008B5DF|nr:hypothetical protein [Longirhabdus pacifica]